MTEFSPSFVLDAEKTVENLRNLWIDSAVPPPLELAEALEDVANLFLRYSEEISAAHRRS